MMLSFMTLQVDFIGVFTHKQPGQSELQNEQNPFFFKLNFLCSVTLNMTFIFKYVYPFNFGFCFLMC